MTVVFVALAALVAFVAREVWRRRPKPADLTLEDFFIPPKADPNTPRSSGTADHPDP